MGGMNTKNINKGFTLIEVLTILLVVAILASVGLPSMTRMLEGNRLSTNTNRLVSSLYAARSEAVKQNIGAGEDITAVKNISAMICTRNTAGDACGGAGTTWKDGWIVFVDGDGDGVRDANEDLLNVVEKSDTKIEVFQKKDIMKKIRSLRFSGDGMVDANSNGTYGEPGPDWVNFQLSSDPDKRIICLGSVGSIRSCNPNDLRQNCKYDKPNCRE
jgi:prepilin-type N-terminal cleavage/methylation domain-containing protein